MFKKSFHIGLTIVAGMLLLAVMGMGSGTEAGSSSEVVTNSVIVHPGVSTSAVAYCPTGTFALDGGAELSNGQILSGNPLAYPGSAPTGWYVVANTETTVSLKVWAICVTQS